MCLGTFFFTYLSKSHSHLFDIGTEIDTCLFVNRSVPVKFQQAVVHADHTFGHAGRDHIVNLVNLVFADHITDRII